MNKRLARQNHTQKGERNFEKFSSLLILFSYVFCLVPELNPTYIRDDTKFQREAEGGGGGGNGKESTNRTKKN